LSLSSSRLDVDFTVFPHPAEKNGIPFFKNLSPHNISGPYINWRSCRSNMTNSYGCVTLGLMMVGNKNLVGHKPSDNSYQVS